MTVPIPPNWIQDVLAALDAGRVEQTQDFSARFYYDFPGSTQGEVEDAFCTFLSGPNPHGCLATMDYPSGETWDFYFQFKGTKTYGKIMLRDGRQKIRLFSAHKPTKPKLRCE